jgi:hypothetical protein
MTRYKQRAALHRKRRHHVRRFPYVRFATVMPSSGRAPEIPCLRLQGAWLNEAGFFTHWRVKVTVTGGKLVIEPLVDALGLFAESGLRR